MNRLFQFSVALGLAVVTLGANTALAADPNVKINKFAFAPGSNDTEVHCNFSVTYKPEGAGDIVFLYYSVGGQKPVLIGNGTSGKVDTVVNVKQTVEEMRKMEGNNPVSLIVWACDVYTPEQALYWIAHHAVPETRAAQIYASGN